MKTAHSKCVLLISNALVLAILAIQSSLLPSRALGTGRTLFVDGDLQQSCSSGNYSVEERACSASGDSLAYKTFAEVTPNLLPGDTLLVRYASNFYAGEAIALTNSGAVSAPITVKNYPSDKPYLSGGSFTIGGSTAPVSHIRIEGFHIHGPNSAAVRVAHASNISIKNLQIEGHTTNNQQAAKGIYLEGTNENILVDSNAIYDIENGITIEAGATNVEVKRNVLHHVDSVGIQALGGQNNTYSYNIIFDSHAGISVSGSAGDKVHHNIVLNNDTFGLSISAPALVSNNTAFGNQTGLAVLVAGGSILNNISSSNASDIAVSTTGSVLIEANLFSDETTPSGATGTLSGTPGFNNAAVLSQDTNQNGTADILDPLNDSSGFSFAADIVDLARYKLAGVLGLAQSSAARDSGTSTFSSLDFNGIPWVGLPDIGAFEHTRSSLGSLQYRVRAGSSDSLLDPNGQTWQGDTSFLSDGDTSSYTVSDDISNTANDALYQTERWGQSFRYEFPATNGTYEVVLHLAELYWWEAGQRVFHVGAEGERRVPYLDIVKETDGTFVPLTIAFPTRVTDGNLTLFFLSHLDNPKISGIEIFALPDPLAPSITPTPGATPTSSTSGSPTATPTRTATPTPTRTATASPTPTATPTSPTSPTPTPVPSTHRKTARSGGWADPGVWIGGVVPLSHDTVEISHPVTVDAHTTIGASLGTGSLPAVWITSSGSLSVSSSIKLTVRGDVILDNAPLSMAQGSTLEFDSSLSSSPASTRYFLKIGADHFQAAARLIALCTAQKRCTVRSSTSNGARAAAITDSEFLERVQEVSNGITLGVSSCCLSSRSESKPHSRREEFRSLY